MKFKNQKLSFFWQSLIFTFFFFSGGKLDITLHCGPKEFIRGNACNINSNISTNRLKEGREFVEREINPSVIKLCDAN